MPVRKKSLARVISSKTVFKGRIFNVVSDQVEEPGNVVVGRQVVRHPGAIVVLAVDDSGREPRVLLERQYRYAANARLWELPAGRIEKGETKLAAAKRELLEETGYTATKWRPALAFYASPGFLDEVLHVFLAQGLTKGRARPEADERITIHFVPLKQVVRMAMTGKIVDAKTIASVLWLERNTARVAK
jgi:ADP-ribose pyrophosphatase